MKKCKKKPESKKRLFNNKKGAISGILTSATNFLSSIFTSMPKPLLYLLFLFLIGTAGGILSLGLTTFGFYCNSANEPVKIDNALLGGISLISQIPDSEIIGLEAYDVEKTQFLTVTDCNLCYEEGEATLIYEDGTERNLTRTECFYKISDRCVTCAGKEVDIELTGLDAKGYCDGNVFRKDKEDMSLLGKAFCGTELIGTCSPPEHYYWLKEQDLYVCADADCEGITVGQRWDELLEDKGAVLIDNPAKGEIDPEGTKMMGVSCKELKPRLTFYGIDLFLIEIWLFITLIIILGWTWHQVRK